MQVTEIKVFPVDEEKLKAFVSIVFDHCFMVNDIKIIRGRDGLFISMPSRRKKNGKFKDVAHPLNNETRQMIEGLVLSEYEAAINGEPAAADRRPRPAEEDRRPQPVAAAAPAPREPEPESAEERDEAQEESDEERTLEEVAELHLRDSFWST